MKILIFLFLFSLPALACKMTREGWELKTKAEALKVVSGKTGRKDLLARRDKNVWLIRSTKPSCVEYRVEVQGGKSNCKMTGEIISERPCP